VILGAPDGFADRLELPTGTKLHRQARGQFDLVLLFATRRAELARRLPALSNHLEDDGSLWVAWPKRTSGVASDLSFKLVQELGLSTGLVDNRMAAIDDAWSGLRFGCRNVGRRRH
jgi:hypothetical protein